MTTTDKMRNRVIGLMQRARHESTPTGEATACREKAEQLVDKYGLSRSLLTDPQVRVNSQPRPEKRYPCRFGCGTFVQHTVEEMSACAERRRNATGAESAYQDTVSFDELFKNVYDDLFRTSYRGYGHHEQASWTRPSGQHAHPNAEHASQPRTRRQTSHANCDHESTKAARAKCRKEREMFGF